MFFNFKKNKINTKYIKNNKKESIYDIWATTKNAQGFFSCIDRLPNPDVILRKMGKGISVLREIEEHSQVSTCFLSRLSGTLGTKWFLKENNCSKERYNFYHEIFNYLDINQFITDILEALLYGYNPIEIQWEKDGSYILPVSLTSKPQEWFFFNSDGEFFFKDINYQGKRKIDLDGIKFILARNKPKFLNPYGSALLSRCFWNVAFINGGMEFWVKFAEKYAMPYMFGKYDRSMTEKEKNQLLETLVNMVQDAVGVIPNDGSVEVMQTGNSSNSNIYYDLITKCENNISKIILGQTLTTDIASTGSYAASNTHMSVRADIINSDKILVEKYINKFIGYINEVNFNDELIPIFEFFRPDDLKTETVERDVKVKSLGVEFSEDYLIRTYGYKKGDIKYTSRCDSGEAMSFDAKYYDGDVEICKANFTGAKCTSQGEQKANDEFDFCATVDRRRGTKSPKSSTSRCEQYNNFSSTNESIEIPDSNLLNISNNPTSPAINEIIKFFSKTKDAEIALEKLEELYPDLNMDELETILTKIIFVSELQGRLDVQNGRN